MKHHARRWAGVVGAFAVGALVAVVPSHDADTGGEFVPLSSPVRLLDTRPGSSTVDGEFAGIGLRPAGSTLRLDVAGRAGLPADAPSVILNVTAVDAQQWGYVTVHPAGTARPNASNLNYDVGTTIANVVITPVGDGGDVSIFTFGATHLLVDAVGHLPGDAFAALPAAARLLDTRPGAATADGTFAGIGRRPAGSTLELDVAGRAGIPGDATSVVLNVTATEPDAWGFLTVHPTGTTQPNASSLNYAAGQTIANTVVAGIGADGPVSIYTFADTHLIVDVAGHLPASSFVPLPAPARALETRPGAGTIDGEQAGIGLRPASSTVRVDLAGRAGLPAEASSVVLNVTAVDALGWGFVTEFPTGAARPNASNLNYDAGATIANTVVARLGAGGDVCLYTYGATHLIVDVVGHFPGPPPSPAGASCPPIVYGPPTPIGGETVSDINNAGIVVGTAYHGSAAFSDALWWPTLTGGPQLVPGVPDARMSRSVAINDRDQVLVDAYSDVTGAHMLVIDLPSGDSVEFGGIESLRSPPGFEVGPIALNDLGEVVLAIWRDSYAPVEVAVWESFTGAVDMHPELIGDSHPHDINDLGHVVGATAADAFYWDRDTDVVHRLDRGGFASADAWVVNDRGQIAGWVYDWTFAGSIAFWPDRWAAPIVLPGDLESVRDLNEAGLLIGSGYFPPGEVSATPWVWDSTSSDWVDFPRVVGEGIMAVNDVGQIIGGMWDDRTAIWQPV